MLPALESLQSPGKRTTTEGGRYWLGCVSVLYGSSLGTGSILKAGNDVVDGLSNAAAKPSGDRSMPTSFDSSYCLVVGAKPYMMAILTEPSSTYHLETKLVLEGDGRRYCLKLRVRIR